MSQHDGQQHICNMCLQYSPNMEIMQRHKEECGRIVTKMVDISKNILKFKNYERQLDVPFSVYADFECILSPEDNQISTGVKNTQRHIPVAFSYYIKCSFNNNFNKLVIYTGEDAAKEFVLQITNDLTQIYKQHLSKNIPLDMTPSDVVAFRDATHCHICSLELVNGDKVRDHCHLSGRFRGAAHNSCNLNLKVPTFIPIFFHNFTNYDSHLFFQHLSCVPGEIKVIPLNKEKYISLSKLIPVDPDNRKLLELRFLDSFRFMASSLDTLSSNLNVSSLQATRTAFNDDTQFKLMTRKGIFPYNYLNNIKRLGETKLPGREEFFNQLTNSECSLEDYEHAQTVWRTFECKNLKEYMELYLKSDVLLLTDVFENFREVCKKIHKLDPCHYYTAPGLSWDAMLRTTKIELELLTDIHMYNYVQRGIRGGLVQCSLRHSKANNKYMSDFDETQPSKYLMYLDANNLYGWAMSQSLPYGGFQWVENTQEFNVSQLCVSSDEGHILEVDLEYPDHLHDTHNDLPFCPSNIKVGSVKKLIADFKPKTKYIVLDKVLKQCLDLGLKLCKVHRILKFNQSPWLKTYIDINNLHRTRAQTAFEKDFFKLLNNAVYGKTMENVDKRKDVKIVTEWESSGRHLGARALIARPNFNSSTTINDSMLVVQMDRVHTVYNKPLYLGFCVLEISKWKMYNFHYSYMKPKYNDRVKLNYMDTDSFIYTIETSDFYEDIKPDISQHFDTSEYAHDNIFNIPLTNKKVLGMMKDENHGCIMREFVGLKSKMYSIDIENSKTIKKSKGVKKSAVDKLSLNTYKRCLIERKIFYDSMYTFRSYSHKLYTQKLKKIVLSYKDDKRFVHPNGIETSAWGHYTIRNN